MKCDPNHGPAVATVRIVFPYLTDKDEICEECVVWWSDFAARQPKMRIEIERLPSEAGWAESVASAVLLLLALLPWMLVG